MARNEEKAQAMLNRWYSMKRELYATDIKNKPRNPLVINSIQECERWRRVILRDFAKKLADIQNAGLGEYKIRALNDELNDMLRDLNGFEKRIKQLGGQDYSRLGFRMYDSQGYQLPGSGEYRYFGAAKDLPGVRELFQRDLPAPPRKSRTEIYKGINCEYYGDFMNDPKFIEIEEIEEKKAIEEEVKKWIYENKNLVPETSNRYEEMTLEEIKKYLQNENLMKPIDNLTKHNESMMGNLKEDPKEEQLRAELQKKKQEMIEKYLNKDNDHQEFDTERLIRENQDLEDVLQKKQKKKS